MTPKLKSVEDFNHLAEIDAKWRKLFFFRQRSLAETPLIPVRVINNNLSDYLVKSKYGKVLQTVLYQQNYVVFLSSKRGGGAFDSRNPLGAPLISTLKMGSLEKDCFRLKVFVQLSS